MAENGVEDLQIASIRPESVQPFWLFNAAARERSLSNEVELLSRRCRTASPNALKQELHYEKRPHSTAGIPLDRQVQKRDRQMAFRGRKGKVSYGRNPKEESFKRVLQKFQPQKAENFTIGPGYVISQTSRDVIATVNTQHTEFPEHVTRIGERRASSRPAHEKLSGDRQMIEDLKMRVDDLSATLEDAKVSHRLEIRKLRDLQAKDLDNMKKEHEEHIKAIEMDNAEELKQVEEDHLRKIGEIAAEASKENNELAREVKVAKAALDAYKESMMKEVNAKWKENELEMKLEHDRRTEKLLQEQRNDLIADKNKELDGVAKEHRRQIAQIVESNKKEMDVLLRKFTATVADAERLKIIMAELEQVKSENEQMRTDLEKSRKLQRSASNELHDVKVKLQMYKDHFAEKVSEVDEKYSQKINDLMIDNSSLRQQYIKKCDELYHVRSERDIKQEDHLIAAKNMMQQVILSRARADVSLTALREDGANSRHQADTDRRTKIPSKTNQKRPTSAPSTDRETTVAVRLSSEGYHTTPAEGTRKQRRPLSSCYMPASSLCESRLSVPLKNAASGLASGRVGEVSKVTPIKHVPPLITVNNPVIHHTSQVGSTRLNLRK